MGTVYVLTPDLATAVGGVRQHYRLVDTLNAAGIPAAIVHRDLGFRCRWFENQTAVVYAEHTHATHDDLIVIPEELVELVSKLAPGVPKIVFNQNTYTTFLWGLSEQQTRAAYHHRDIWCTLVVSEDNATYLRRVFPDVRVERVRVAIDTQVYHPGGERRRAVSYMPRKRKSESAEVLALLRVSGALDGWEVLAIDGLDEHAAAERIRCSSIFLSFSHREGFGLPPAEAMASGCLVVGFDGFAGREFFAEHAITVPEGDVQAYCAIVTELLCSWGEQHPKYLQMATTGADFVAREYSVLAHEQSVIPLFRAAMSAPRTRSARGRLEVPRFGPSRLNSAGQHIKHALHAATVRHSFADSHKHVSAALSVLKRGYE